MHPLTGLVALGLLAIIVYRRVIARKLPLPPGPTGELIAGSLKPLMTLRPWLVYMKWAETYGKDPPASRICISSKLKLNSPNLSGPVISYRVYHQRVVVLNSAKAVVDLLESKAPIYSDRPIVSDVAILLARNMCSLFIGDFADVDGSTPHRPCRCRIQHLGSESSPQEVQETAPLWFKQPRHTNISTYYHPGNLHILEGACYHSRRFHRASWTV